MHPHSLYSRAAKVTRAFPLCFHRTSVFSKSILTGCLLWTVCGGTPLFAQTPEAASQTPVGVVSSPVRLADWQSEVARLSTLRDPYERLSLAAQLAQAIERSSEPEANLAATMASQIDALVESVFPRLSSYPTLERVHGHEEPTWLSDRGDVTAQAVLAEAALQRWRGDPKRRDRLKKLADGLAALQRTDRIEYPFGAHLGWEDWEPMTVLDDGTRVPSTFYQAQRAYAVRALAEASKVLNDPELLVSAEREALGMSTHLVIAGRLLDSFSPQPEYTNDLSVAVPLVEGFLALFAATDKTIYADLAALATLWVDSPKASTKEWAALVAQVERTPARLVLAARPTGEPISFQVMEAEKGKVVNNAIETLGFQSPSGERGELASMGRENTFWMRFDVPTEDDYVFYLTYLQSDVGGGLVSVMMRIDGDKIFQVPLGDVDGRPIMRRKFVDGPRPLRSGPHSFGIRFSGLLMTKPALLDSVIVQPAVERREFSLANGERLVLMRNVTGAVARTDRAGFGSWPPMESIVVDGQGAPAKLGSADDKRRRKQFVTLPPYGVAVLKLGPAAPKTE